MQPLHRPAQRRTCCAANICSCSCTRSSTSWFAAANCCCCWSRRSSGVPAAGTGRCGTGRGCSSGCGSCGAGDGAGGGIGWRRAPAAGAPCQGSGGGGIGCTSGQPDSRWDQKQSQWSIAQRPAQVDFTLHPQKRPSPAELLLGWAAAVAGLQGWAAAVLLAGAAVPPAAAAPPPAPPAPPTAPTLAASAANDCAWRPAKPGQGRSGAWASAARAAVAAAAAAAAKGAWQDTVGDDPPHLLPLPQRLAELGPRQGLLGTHHRHGERTHGCRRGAARGKCPDGCWQPGSPPIDRLA